MSGRARRRTARGRAGDRDNDLERQDHHLDEDAEAARSRQQRLADEAAAEEQRRNQLRQRSRSRSPLPRSDSRQRQQADSRNVIVQMSAEDIAALVAKAANNVPAAPGPQKPGPLAAVHDALDDLLRTKAEDRGATTRQLFSG